MFKENKYVAVKELVSQEIVQIVSQYALINEMISFTGETDKGIDKAQVPGAHGKYADTLMESILIHLQPKLEYITGLTLHPTYSYFRVYRSGMELKPHIDRPSCEISTTVCFKYNYIDLQDSLVWPMYIRANNQSIPIGLKPGDGIVYRGLDLTHWREPLTAPDYSYHIQGFFHYVDANGPYADYQLDKRLFIGQPKTIEQSTPAVSTKNYISTVN